MYDQLDAMEESSGNGDELSIHALISWLMPWVIVRAIKKR